MLLKRRTLIEHGYPESTLLITVVRDENNEGHAVLTVRTDQGDFVLDNKRREVMRWADTPYTYRQAAVREESAGLDLASAAGRRAANRGVSLQQPLAGVFDTPVQLGRF